MTILVIEDKLGITDAYKPAWTSLLLQTHLNPKAFVYRSAWRDPRLAKIHGKLLIRKGNRKSPGFNPDGLVQKALAQWLLTQLKTDRKSVV